MKGTNQLAAIKLERPVALIDKIWAPKWATPVVWDLEVSLRWTEGLPSLIRYRQHIAFTEKTKHASCSIAMPVMSPISLTASIEDTEWQIRLCNRDGGLTFCGALKLWSAKSQYPMRGKSLVLLHPAGKQHAELQVAKVLNEILEAQSLRYVSNQLQLVLSTEAASAIEDILECGLFVCLTSSLGYDESSNRLTKASLPISPKCFVLSKALVDVYPSLCRFLTSDAILCSWSNGRYSHQIQSQGRRAAISMKPNLLLDRDVEAGTIVFANLAIEKPRVRDKPLGPQAQDKCDPDIDHCPTMSPLATRLLRQADEVLQPFVSLASSDGRSVTTCSVQRTVEPSLNCYWKEARLQSTRAVLSGPNIASSCHEVSSSRSSQEVQELILKFRKPADMLRLILCWRSFPRSPYQQLLPSLLSCIREKFDLTDIFNILGCPLWLGWKSHEGWLLTFAVRQAAVDGLSRKFDEQPTLLSRCLFMLVQNLWMEAPLFRRIRLIRQKDVSRGPVTPLPPVGQFLCVAASRAAKSRNLSLLSRLFWYLYIEGTQQSASSLATTEACERHWASELEQLAANVLLGVIDTIMTSSEAKGIVQSHLQKQFLWSRWMDWLFRATSLSGESADKRTMALRRALSAIPVVDVDKPLLDDATSADDAVLAPSEDSSLDRIRESQSSSECEGSREEVPSSVKSLIAPAIVSRVSSSTTAATNRNGSSSSALLPEFPKVLSPASSIQPGPTPNVIASLSGAIQNLFGWADRKGEDVGANVQQKYWAIDTAISRLFGTQQPTDWKSLLLPQNMIPENGATMGTGRGNYISIWAKEMVVTSEANTASKPRLVFPPSVTTHTGGLFPFSFDGNSSPILKISSEKSKVLKSASYPILLSCVIGENNALKEYLYKVGDDLRQDLFVNVTFELIAEELLRKRYHINPCMRPYRIIPMSADAGLIEFVARSLPLSEFRKQPGGLASFLSAMSITTTTTNGVEGNCSPGRGAVSPEQGNHPFRCQDVENCPKNIVADPQDKFITSCAIYSILTYILAVGDRHQDNMLVDDTGGLFHVDFGYILGSDPKPFASPMRISSDMILALGGINSAGYQLFKIRCLTFFHTLRKHVNFLSAFLSLTFMSSIGDIARVRREVLANIQKPQTGWPTWANITSAASPSAAAAAAAVTGSGGPINPCSSSVAATTSSSNSNEQLKRDASSSTNVLPPLLQASSSVPVMGLFENLFSPIITTTDPPSSLEEALGDEGVLIALLDTLSSSSSSSSNNGRREEPDDDTGTNELLLKREFAKCISASEAIGKFGARLVCKLEPGQTDHVIAAEGLVNTIDESARALFPGVVDRIHEWVTHYLR